eukprot:PhF_6_TR1074/c0_g1_i1/m.2265
MYSCWNGRGSIAFLERSTVCPSPNGHVLRSHVDGDGHRQVPRDLRTVIRTHSEHDGMVGPAALHLHSNKSSHPCVLRDNVRPRWVQHKCTSLAFIFRHRERLQQYDENEHDDSVPTAPLRRGERHRSVRPSHDVFLDVLLQRRG